MAQNYSQLHKKMTKVAWMAASWKKLYLIIIIIAISMSYFKQLKWWTISKSEYWRGRVGTSGETRDRRINLEMAINCKYWAQAASKLLAVIRRNLFQTPRPPLRHKNITAGHTGRHRAGQQRTPGTRPATRPANLVLVTDPNLMRLMLNISHSKL